MPQVIGVRSCATVDRPKLALELSLGTDTTTLRVTRQEWVLSWRTRDRCLSRPGLWHEQRIELQNGTTPAARGIYRNRTGASMPRELNEDCTPAGSRYGACQSVSRCRTGPGRPELRGRVYNLDGRTGEPPRSDRAAGVGGSPVVPVQVPE